MTMNPDYKRTQLTRLANTAVQFISTGIETLAVLNSIARNDLSLGTTLTAGNYFCTVQYRRVYRIIFSTYVFANPGTMTNGQIQLYINGVATALAQSRYTSQVCIQGQWIGELKPGDQLLLRGLISGGGSPSIGDVGGYPGMQTSLNIIEI